MNLLNKQSMTLNSGLISDFKINICDTFTDEGWECIAHLIFKARRFKEVIGIPTGGLKLAAALQPYCIDNPEAPTLLCDDVLTTGNSMERFRQTLDPLHNHIIGLVVFSRIHIKKVPSWITPLFILNELLLPSLYWSVSKNPLKKD